MADEAPVNTHQAHLRYGSARYLLALIVLSIFSVEGFIIFMLAHWPIQSPLLTGMTDSLLLTLIVFPVLYFFAFRPLAGMRQKLHTSEEAFKSIFVESIDGILAVDNEGYVLFANDAAGKLLNRQQEDLAGTLFGMPLTAASVTQIEIPQKQGHTRVVEMHTMNSIWNGQDAFLVSLHDITDFIEKTETLHEQSISDALTGLKNRRGFHLLAGQQIKLADRSGELLIFFIDLDGMKKINDTYGHKTGDQALIDIAQILKRTFRDSDVIARMGGDEFAVVAIASGEEAKEAMCERLISYTETHNLQANRDYQLRLSYGVVNYDPARQETLQDILVRADALMYEQKQAGKNRGKTVAGQKTVAGR